MNFIIKHGLVLSYNPQGTYWTTLFTDDPYVAESRLALDRTPKYRIGGIPLSSINQRYIKYQGKIKPNNGKPGGAWEILITQPVVLSSIYEFQTQKCIYIELFKL